MSNLAYREICENSVLISHDDNADVNVTYY